MSLQGRRPWQSPGMQYQCGKSIDEWYDPFHCTGRSPRRPLGFLAMTVVVDRFCNKISASQREDLSISPSLAGILLHNAFSFQGNKKVLAPKSGNKDRKDTFCGTTLFAVLRRPLCPVPTHRLPVNAGIASEDTLPCGISPCPRRPIVPNRFSLRSQLCRTLCGCASGFTPASMVSNYVMPFIHEKCAFVKNYFASAADKFLNIPGQRPAPHR